MNAACLSVIGIKESFLIWYGKSSCNSLQGLFMFLRIPKKRDEIFMLVDHYLGYVSLCYSYLKSIKISVAFFSILDFSVCCRIF